MIFESLSLTFRYLLNNFLKINKKKLFERVLFVGFWNLMWSMTFVPRDCEVGRLDDVTEERRAFVATVTEMPFTCFTLQAPQDFCCSFVVKTRPPPPLHPHTPRPPPARAYRAAQSLGSRPSTMPTLCFCLLCDHDSARFRLHTTSNTSSCTETLQLISVCLLEDGPHQCKHPKLKPTHLFMGTSRCLLMI